MIYRSNSIAVIAGCGLMLCLVPLTARASALPEGFVAPASQEPSITLVAPVPDSGAVRSFLSPNSDYSAGHRGIDYAVPVSQQLNSPTTGRIYFNGPVADRRVVTIERPNGDLISLEPACSDFAVGTMVSVGQQLGSYCPGETGYRDHCEKLLAGQSSRQGTGSTLRCLHFSYRTERGYLSPDAVMGVLEPSRLTTWTDA